MQGARERSSTPGGDQSPEPAPEGRGAGSAALPAGSGDGVNPAALGPPVLAPLRRASSEGGLDGEPLGAARGGESDDVGDALRGIELEIARAEEGGARERKASEGHVPNAGRPPFPPDRPPVLAPFGADALGDAAAIGARGAARAEPPASQRDQFVASLRARLDALQKERREGAPVGQSREAGKGSPSARTGLRVRDVLAARASARGVRREPGAPSPARTPQRADRGRSEVKSEEGLGFRV